VQAERAVALATTMRTRVWEIEAHLAHAHALRHAHGASAATDIETTLERAAALVDETGAAGLAPFVHCERAELARLLGDEAGWQRELREALRLFAAMGATGHAERISRQLSAVSAQPEGIE
jgi:hypothetical protein